MIPGYWPSPWPCEDGGPRRSAAPAAPVRGLALTPGEHLAVTARSAPGATMVVLRAPGEVFLTGHTFGDDVVAWVERVDPLTLAPLARSPDLPAGPFWPGGIAAHANGSLYVTCGRWCHKLDPDCRPIAGRELPQPRLYNSLLVLSDGSVVTMRDAGVTAGPVHLVRAAVADGSCTFLTVSGLPRDAITNPPLYDPERRIVVAFDSANARLGAWRVDRDAFVPLWSRPSGTASHMIRYPDTGELVVNDHGPDGDAVVVLDLETGAERARARTGSPVQSVVFPAVGWGHDFYYCSFATFARVAPAA